MCGMANLNADNFGSIAIQYPVFIAVLIEEGLPAWMRVIDRGIFHTPLMQRSVLWSENPRGKKGTWVAPAFHAIERAQVTSDTSPKAGCPKTTDRTTQAASWACLPVLGWEDDSHRALLTCLQ